MPLSTPPRAESSAAKVSAWWLGGLAVWVSVQAAQAATGTSSYTMQGGIYSCVDAHGKRLTSDRPIPECLDREQRVLNKDGSQRKVLPPRQTPQERAAAEEARRQKETAELAYKDAVRRDRNLMGRYPHEAAHNKARQSALDDVRKAMASSEKRVADLKAERKPLLADAEFYKGKPMPFKLRSSLEGNQASQEAQLEIIENQRAEMVRINALYDLELARLRKLWAGAEPGSIPDVSATPAASAASGVAVSKPGVSARPTVR
ncbi:MAG TPA: DUF4124 domain-containing protein [Aquabacterium sp.]|uniref:DUF4124 domain-containing protein n=1 Tax=Aquabacterium sp. TaxID=1872578 RepID=UPI002E3753E5|nr:DUF4124 domain-containing protein [Aquabacterium sp.]HEX5355773.1 DUF4124 domain-containing protein [Aquabacterium sp.]